MLSGGNSTENRKRLCRLIQIALDYLKEYDRAHLMHANLAKALGRILVVEDMSQIRPPANVGAPPSLDKQTEQTLGVLLALFAAIERHRLISQDVSFCVPLEKLTKITTQVPTVNATRPVTAAVNLNVTVAMYNFICWAHTHGEDDRGEWITSGVARGLVGLIPEVFYKVAGRDSEEIRADAAVKLLERDRGISYASVHADLHAVMKETGWEWVPSE